MWYAKGRFYHTGGAGSGPWCRLMQITVHQHGSAARASSSPLAVSLLSNSICGDVAASQCTSRWSDKVALLHLSQQGPPCCQTLVGPGKFPGHTLSLVTLVLLAENKRRQVGPQGCSLFPFLARSPQSSRQERRGMESPPMIGFLQTERQLGPDAIMR